MLSTLHLCLLVDCRFWSNTDQTKTVTDTKECLATSARFLSVSTQTSMTEHQIYTDKKLCVTFLLRAKNYSGLFQFSAPKIILIKILTSKKACVLGNGHLQIEKSSIYFVANKYESAVRWQM